MNKRPTARRRHLATSPFPPEPEVEIEQYAVADRVSHDAYGLGRVLTVDENSVTVDFGTRSVHIASPFHRLEKL